MKQLQINYNPPIEDVKAYIDASKPLYVDFETYNETTFYKGGLYGSIRLAQFMQDGWDSAIVVDLRWGVNANKIDVLHSIIHNGNWVVGYNFHYDFATLQEHSQIHTRINLNKYTDLLILVKELYPLQRADSMHNRFSLEDSYDSILGYDPYEVYGMDKKTLQKAKWGGVLSDEMVRYAAIDVFYMPELHQALVQAEASLLDSFTEYQRYAYHTRIWNSKLAVDAGLIMQEVGLQIDPELAEEYYNKYKNVQQEAFTELKREYNIDDKFNFTSPKQVKELTGLPATDKVTLSFACYRDGNKAVKYIMNYRKGSSRSATVKKWMKLSLAYGKITGKFSPTTVTGRFSSSQENMQNQPRDSKGVFRAPDNELLIGFDYAQIELRTMCALTGDKNMYKVFKEFGDIHSNTQEMCRISIRNVAKQVNFGNLYGMGIPKFQELLIKDGIYLPEDEIKVIRDLFLGLYSSIPEYHRQGLHNSKVGTPNYSILGHPYFSKFFNQMNNLANQASGTAEVAKMFFRLADELDLLYGEYSKLSVQIHDSNLFNYSGLHKYAEHYATAIALLSQKAWFTCLSLGYTNGTSKYNDIPMPVEVGVATKWADIDNNILVDLKGTEYIDNTNYYEEWFKWFKNDLQPNNARREYLME